jgi:hypothetical protein
VCSSDLSACTTAVASGCTAVTCATNKLDTNGNAADGCEATVTAAGGPAATPAAATPAADIMDPSSSIAISGSFTLSSITHEDVKASEESIKKVIAKMYNILEKYITIVSIEEVDKSNGKNRFLVSYTIKGFADQATADQAKESFETTVTDGSKFCFLG